jgi:hypothetical protein
MVLLKPLANIFDRLAAYIFLLIVIAASSKSRNRAIALYPAVTEII